VYTSLNLSVNEIQPILLDSRSIDGPFISAFSHLFSSSRRLLDIRQLIASTFPEHNDTDKHKNLCFKRAVWTVHGGSSPLSNGNAQPAECQISPLYRAFREFMMDRIEYYLKPNNGLSKKIYNEKLARNKDLELENEVLKPWHFTVTYGIRKCTTSSGPVPGLLENSTIHGLSDLNIKLSAQQIYQQNSTNFGQARKLERIIENENEFIDFMRDGVKKYKPYQDRMSLISQFGSTINDFKRKNPRKHTLENTFWWSNVNVNVTFQAVDFATLSFEEQIKLASKTDVFVAPHGAAFYCLLYLRMNPTAGVVEMKPSVRRAGNFQFENLAAKVNSNLLFFCKFIHLHIYFFFLKMGHRYKSVNIDASLNDRQKFEALYQIQTVLDEIIDIRISHLKRKFRNR
jgi:hypothetical protein